MVCLPGAGQLQGEAGLLIDYTSQLYPIDREQAHTGFVFTPRMKKLNDREFVHAVLYLAKRRWGLNAGERPPGREPMPARQARI